MINEKVAKLLKKVILEKYGNVRLENIVADENEFYYEFKANEEISENDLENLEELISKLDNQIFVKLLRVSGVYFEGNAENEMITRISGKDFESKEELEKYEEFLKDAQERDHRKIGRDLDLFCFSDYLGAGLPLYTPRGTIVKDELQKQVEKICRNYGFQKVSCPSLANIKLFETSGHAQKFNDELLHFCVVPYMSFSLQFCFLAEIGLNSLLLICFFFFTSLVSIPIVSNTEFLYIIHIAGGEKSVGQ